MEPSEFFSVLSVLTWIGDRLSLIAPEGESVLEMKRKRVADYFLEIANCLSRIADELSNNQIPTEYGNYLESLVDGLDLVIASNLCGKYEIIPGDNAEWLPLLKNALKHADRADGAIMFARRVDLTEQASIDIKHHVRSIRQTAGVFRGISQRTRSLGIRAIKR